MSESKEDILRGPGWAAGPATERDIEALEKDTFTLHIGPDATGRDRTGIMEQIGAIDVDSGRVWIGDPCYIPNNLKVVEEVNTRSDLPGPSNSEQLTGGHQSRLAVLVHTLGGDGRYPVEAERDEKGRIVKVQIRFDKLFPSPVGRGERKR